MVKFEEVKAFQCVHCNRLFLTNKHHKACIADPDTIHCGTCKHYCYEREKIASTPFGNDYQEPRHTCDKGHNNTVPRKESCPDYEFYIDSLYGEIS